LEDRIGVLIRPENGDVRKGVGVRVLYLPLYNLYITGERMNTANAVRLGSMCQKRFHMKDDYHFYEIKQPVNSIAVGVAGQKTQPVTMTEKICFCDAELTTVRCGYSRKANVLVVRELQTK
jgi:hypothetical protein